MPSIALIISLAFAAPVPTASPAATPPAEKKICKKQTETGTRVRAKRECLTEAEWKMREADAKRALQDQQARTNGR